MQPKAIDSCGWAPTKWSAKGLIPSASRSRTQAWKRPSLAILVEFRILVKGGLMIIDEASFGKLYLLWSCRDNAGRATEEITPTTRTLPRTQLAISRVEAIQSWPSYYVSLPGCVARLNRGCVYLSESLSWPRLRPTGLFRVRGWTVPIIAWVGGAYQISAPSNTTLPWDNVPLRSGPGPFPSPSRNHAR